MISPERARTIEQYLFGALLGFVLGALIIRFAMMAVPMNAFVLLMLLGIGAWTGMFAMHFGAKSSLTFFETAASWSSRLRAYFLKTMLWLLGAAAVIGVLTALTASYGVFGRIAFTIFCSGAAAGLLYLCATLMNVQKARSAGLLGMASVLVVYVLVLPLIWRWGDADQAGFLTALVVSLTTPAAMIFLRLLHSPTARLSGFVGLAFWAALLSVWQVAIWQDSWHAAEDWWVTGWALVLCGVLCVLSLLHMDLGLLRWQWLGAAASLAACTLLLFSIWTDYRESEELLTVLLSIPIVVGHANLVSMVPLRRGQRWIASATIAGMIVTAATIDGMVILDQGGFGTLLGRLAGAAAIVSSCGSLALIVLAALNRSVSAAVPDTKQLVDITIVCPGCNSKQRIPIGLGECNSCGMAFRIEIVKCDGDRQSASHRDLIEHSDRA